MRKLLLLFLLIPALTYAADASSPKAMVEAFFSGLQKADVSGAYTILLKGSPIPKDKPESLVTLKQQTQNVLPFYGIAYTCPTKQDIKEFIKSARMVNRNVRAVVTGGIISL